MTQIPNHSFIAYLAPENVVLPNIPFASFGNQRKYGHIVFHVISKLENEDEYDYLTIHKDYNDNTLKIDFEKWTINNFFSSAMLLLARLNQKNSIEECKRILVVGNISKKDTFIDFSKHLQEEYKQRDPETVQRLFPNITTFKNVKCLEDASFVHLYDYIVISCKYVPKFVQKQKYIQRRNDTLLFQVQHKKCFLGGHKIAVLGNVCPDQLDHLFDTDFEVVEEKLNFTKNIQIVHFDDLSQCKYPHMYDYIVSKQKLPLSEFQKYNGVFVYARFCHQKIVTCLGDNNLTTEDGTKLCEFVGCSTVACFSKSNQGFFCEKHKSIIHSYHHHAKKNNQIEFRELEMKSRKIIDRAHWFYLNKSKNNL